LALGAIAVWASENLFWTLPRQDLTVLDWILTWIAYALAAACALAMVIVTGVRGMAAAFLGGAVIGFVAEGVVVGTMYDAFPFQLVWTPMAWHALITGGLVFGLGRAGLPAARMVAIWAGLGLCGGIWGLCWRAEGLAEPFVGTLLFYLVAVGVIVPLAQVVLDRIGDLPRPSKRVMWVAPVVLAAVWLVQGVIAPSPLRLVLPLVLAIIWWVMRRLGGPGAQSFGPAVGVWRHGLFLIMPLVTVLITVGFWARVDLAATWLVALVTSLVSVVWLGVLVWRAVRAGPVV
jgi:hypothetical protein